MSKSQKTWIAVGVSVVVIAAAVLVVLSLRNQNSSASNSYQTTTVQLGTLTSTVEGTGTVASTQTANLAWQNSGQVDQVLVQIGNQVKTGDVLAILQRDSLTQSTLETSLANAQENLALLTSPAAIASAQAAVASDEVALANAQVKVNNLGYHDHGAIDNAKATLILSKENLDNATAAYNSLNLSDSDPAKARAYQTMYGAQLKYNNALYAYNSLTGNASQTSIDSANAALAQAKANLAQDKAYLAALTGGTVPADATGSAYLKLKQAQLAVQTAHDNLDATKLTAPFDGTITQANVMPQAVVSAGTQAFRIDNLASLVVAVQVTEVDINGVQAGQPAAISFNAIPNKTFNGTVTKTDLAGTVGQNSTNFSVSVQITDADAKVKPGMAANVTITTNKVDNALLIPSTSIFTDTKGQQYVYLVQNDGSKTTVAITVGAVSDTSTQVTGSALKEGDTIILSFASTSSSSNGGFGFGGPGGITGGGEVQVAQPSSGTP